MKRILINLMLVMSALCTPLVAFHVYYEHYSRKLIREHHIHYEKANAIKHALAAANLTKMLAPILGDTRAESTVLWLGLANEYSEQLIRVPRDSTAEIVKDMTNNQIGITAALWIRQHSVSLSPGELLLQLANEPILVKSANDVPLSKEEASLKHWDSIKAAQRRLEEKRLEVIQRTLDTLQKATASLR